MERCKVVAEIGCSHGGSLDRAKMLAKLAADCGVYCVKTQKRNPVEAVPAEWHNRPHPNPKFSYGKNYLEHRKNLELSIEEHAELKKYCEEIGVVYSCSVWDIQSCRDIISLNPDFIKVGSPTNLNFEIYDLLMNEYEGDIHVSFGMTTREEEKKIIDYLKEVSNRVVLYWCTSEYPCVAERLYLKEIERFVKIYEPLGFRIAYSSHSYGISTECVSYVLGAQFIEKHVIDDRCFAHSDASASLEEQGLKRLVRDLNHIYEAMQYKTEMSSEELAQRDKLKFPK